MHHFATAITRALPRLGDAARFAAWAYTPFQRLAAPEFYGLLATRVCTANRRYLNLG